MAYKWSWAFGAETALELNNLAQWTMGTTTPADVYPESTIVHTYMGDVADRYSLATEGDIHAGPKNGIGNVRGWAACYFYFNNASGFTSSNDIFRLIGPVSTGLSTRRMISARALGGNGLNLNVGGSIFIGSVTGLQNFAWNHIALKYDMFSGGTAVDAEWSAELYVNGVLSASGSRQISFLKEEFDCYFELTAPSSANLPNNTFFSDIVFYNSQADPNPYGQFVTRVEMDRDSSDSGSWTPASNTGTNAQSANLSGSISTTPVVSEANPLTGENIIVSSSQTIAAQLGITPTSVYGATGHLFASGSSSTNLFSAVAEATAPGLPFTSGTTQIDGENMYAWVTAPTTPVGPAWVSSSTIVLKAEVSGS
tara:strand:+ start:83 stop:1186 length:1104 start_codon:yes stop_codon:yes gene_type:complete